jgi:hypothetical protein
MLSHTDPGLTVRRCPHVSTSGEVVWAQRGVSSGRVSPKDRAIRARFAADHLGAAAAWARPHARAASSSPGRG